MLGPPFLQSITYSIVICGLVHKRLPAPKPAMLKKRFLAALYHAKKGFQIALDHAKKRLRKRFFRGIAYPRICCADSS